MSIIDKLIRSNRVKKVITECCGCKVEERYDYCPLCGDQIVNKHKLKWKKEMLDLEATMYSCDACGEIQPMMHKYCVKCGNNLR